MEYDLSSITPIKSGEYDLSKITPDTGYDLSSITPFTPMSQGKAAESGYLQSSLAMAEWLRDNLPGLPDAAKTQHGKDALAIATKQGLEAAQQHPLTTGAANLAPKLVAGLATMPIAAATLGGLPTLPASMLGGAMAGLPVAGAEQEETRARVMQQTGGDKEAADAAANATFWTQMGAMTLPGGVGTKLLPKVLTGAGLNVAAGEADVAIQNQILAEKYPHLKQELLDPKRMALNAAFGAVTGPMASVRGKDFSPTAMRKEMADKKWEKQMGADPTPEVLAERVKTMNMDSLRGIENDIHAVHQRAYNKEQQVARLEKDITELNDRLVKAATDPIANTEAIERSISEKQLRKTELTKSIADDDELIKRNEVAYSEMAQALGETPRTNLERAKAYAEEAKVSGSGEAARRAAISAYRSTRDQPRAVVESASPAARHDVEVGNATVIGATKAEADLLAKIEKEFGLPPGTVIDMTPGRERGITRTPNGHVIPDMPYPEAQKGSVRMNYLRAKLDSFTRAWSTGLQVGRALTAKYTSNLIMHEEYRHVFEAYTVWKANINNTGWETKGDKLTWSLLNQPKNYADDFFKFFSGEVERVLAGKTSSKFFYDYVKNHKALWAKTAGGFKVDGRLFTDDLIRALVQNSEEGITAAGRGLYQIAAARESRDLSNNLGVSRVTYGPPQTLDEVVAAIDGDIAPISRLMNILESALPLNQKAAFTGNAAVRYVVNAIREAQNKTTARINRILGGEGVALKGRSIFTSFKFVVSPDSWQALDKGMSVKDRYDVMQVFLAGQNRLDYESNLRVNGAHLTPEQVKYYRATAKVFEDTWKEMNVSQVALGKKHEIPFKMGYVPPVRKGDYAVTIRGPIEYTRGVGRDDLGHRTADVSSVVYTQRFFTQAEADAFARKFASLPREIRGDLVADKAEIIPHVTNPYQIDFIQSMREEAIRAGADKSVIERMDKMLQEAIGKGGTVGAHHKKQMGFIKGAMGQELFESPAAQGKAFGESVVNYVKETTTQMQKVEISTKVDQLLVREEVQAQPNLTDFLRGTRDYALNAGEDVTDKLEKNIKSWLDEVAVTVARKVGIKNWYPKAHVYDTAMGKGTHAFYLSVLTSRPTFWVAQSTAFTTSFRAMVRDQGILAANLDIAGGFNRFLTNDQDLFKYFMWARENTGSLHPEFINDLTKFGIFENNKNWSGVMLRFLSGETPSAAADSFSRAMSASFFFEMYSKKGLKGDKLYRAVTEAVDENMILYGKGQKAPMYSRVPIVGGLVSPLATFSHAQIVNLANDLKFFFRNPSYQTALPFLVTFATSIMVGGVLGGVGIAELVVTAGIINLLLDLTEWEFRLPSLWDIVLGSPTKAAFGETNEFIDRTISHGLLSSSTLLFGGEGFDIGSPNRWRPIVAGIVEGEKTLLSMMPMLKWSLQYAGAATDIVTKGKEMSVGAQREAMRRITPAGPLFAAVDLKFGALEPGPKPHPKDDPLVERSTQEWFATLAGTQTMKEHMAKTKDRLDKEHKMKIDREVNAGMRAIALGEVPAEEVNKRLTKYQDVYKKTPDELYGMYTKFLEDASVSEEKYKGKWGTVSPEEQAIEDRYWGVGK